MMPAELEFYQGKGFIAEIIRTDRKKTATVRVEHGKVSVVVPDGLSDIRIQEVVNNKARWVREKLHIQSKHYPVRSKEYVAGECFAYLGKNYRLKIQSGTHRDVKLKNGRLVVTLPDQTNSPVDVKKALEGWYRRHALLKLTEKVARYAEIIGVAASSVNIKTFKSRWGSCTTAGDVTFNWKIVIAPNRIVDYVVVHELCHMKHHDHSLEFWKSVEKVIPDYLSCKEWLKDNGSGLQV